MHRHERGVRTPLKGTSRAALALAAVFVFALSLAAYGAPASGTPYVFNTILPLTGGAAFLGQAEAQTLRALEPWVNARGGINGRPVHFAIQDDQTSPQVGVQLASQVIAKRVPVILGSSLVAICRAMAPLMKDGPVMYCFSPGIHPDEGSYVFSAGASTRDLAQATIAFFRGKGWTRIAVLTSTDATGQDAEQGINAAVESQGVQIIDREHFTPTDVSVSAQIAHVGASKAQAFIAWSTGAPIATVFKAIAQSGLNIPVVTTDGNMTVAQLQQYASFLPAELYSPTSLWAAYPVLQPGRVKLALRGFLDTMEAAHAKPDRGSTLAWDAPLMVIDALRHLGTQATAPQIKDYLEHLRGFAGINGIYDFKASPQRGLTLQDTIITRWDVARQTWDPVSRPGGAPLK